MPTINHRIVGPVRYSLENGKIRLLDGWADRNIVTVDIPQLRGVEGVGGPEDGKVKWHKATAHQLKGAFAEIEASGLKHLLKSCAGTFYPRLIRGAKRTPSEHSFGTAIDINAAWNGLGRTPAKAGTEGSVRELVAIFEKWGFRWGGYFKRGDGMHFEIARRIAFNEPPMPKPKAAAVPERTFELNGIVIPDAFVRDSRLFVPALEWTQAMKHKLHGVQDGSVYRLRTWEEG